MKKLSIIIPVYYNEQSLPILFVELSEVKKKLDKSDVELDEVLFVGDG